LCSAGCGEETYGTERPAGAGLARKHAGLHGKEFILLLVVLVSHISFWLMPMMLIYWEEVYIL